MDSAPAKHRLLDQLTADGVEVIFGNPGTFEQGLLDALRDHPKVRYILGLQEAAIVAMATNYARLGRRPAVVQLHAGVGLGNAMGALQEAYRGEVPLLILCGENSTSAEPLDGYLAYDLVELARPVTKWAARLISDSQFLQLVRRAWARAQTPPRGPVLLTFPMDVLERPITEEPAETVLPTIRTCPGPDVLREIADALRVSRQPLVLIGDAVAWSGAEADVLDLAARTSAQVFGMNLTMAGMLLSHPLFSGFLRYSSGDAVAEVTRKADVVLTVGATLGSEVLPRTNRDYLGPGAKLFQIDPNALEIGKNVQPSIGIVADPKSTLRAICEVLETEGLNAMTEYAGVPAPVDSSSSFQGSSLTNARMMRVLSEVLPENALIVEESMTAADHLRTALRQRPDITYLSCLSRGLGSGLPAGISAKLLNPRAPVAAVSADGAAMYVIPCLWTAAHLKLDIVFIICNNASYRSLKNNIAAYWRAIGQSPRAFPFMDLADPPLRFAEMGRGMGLSGWYADDEESLRKALSGAYATPGAHIIDVQVVAD